MPLEEGDVEQLLIDYLTTALPANGFTVPVADQMVAPECVVLYRVGGADRDQVTGFPSVILEAYAATNTRASQILRRVFALVRDLYGRQLGAFMVYDVQVFRGPSSDPKPPADLVRYSAMVAVAVRMNQTV